MESPKLVKDESVFDANIADGHKQDDTSSDDEAWGSLWPGSTYVTKAEPTQDDASSNDDFPEVACSPKTELGSRWHKPTTQKKRSNACNLLYKTKLALMPKGRAKTHHFVQSEAQYKTYDHPSAELSFAGAR